MQRHDRQRPPAQCLLMMSPLPIRHDATTPSPPHRLQSTSDFSFKETNQQQQQPTRHNCNNKAVRKRFLYQLVFLLLNMHVRFLGSEKLFLVPVLSQQV